MFQVKYVVVDSFDDADFVRNWPDGIPVWFFVVLKTPALLRIGGRWVECEADSFVLYPPMTPVYYEACGAHHHEEWIQFLSDDAELQEPYVPFARPVKLLNPFGVHELMRILAYENIAGYSEREKSMEAMMKLLVYKMHDSCVNREAVSMDSRLLHLRSQIYLHPGKEWTVHRMAEMVYLSESRLHTMYKAAFRITCMNDVIMSRIRYAQNMLECTDKPVLDIALECGYHGNEHFCRQFKEKTGLTPGQYRSKYAIPRKPGQD